MSGETNITDPERAGGGVQKNPKDRTSNRKKKRSPWQVLVDGISYLVTGGLIRFFWLFESTIDIRAWGTETLRLLKRGGEHPLLVLWHGKGFVPIAYFHHERLCLYASTDRDPNYGGMRKSFRWLTLRMIERMGYRVLDASQFASESRGVMQYVQALRGGSGGAIAADGPGGPIYQAKPGACFLAKKTGVTLLPVGSAISAGSKLDQWDQFEIPRMFCRAAIVVERPIYIDPESDDDTLEARRLELEAALNRATRKAGEKLRQQPFVPDNRPATSL
jgi:lysophospholipid acyltransferase (LPLAT)-like uncharacterized protein